MSDANAWPVATALMVSTKILVRNADAFSIRMIRQRMPSMAVDSHAIDRVSRISSPLSLAS